MPRTTRRGFLASLAAATALSTRASAAGDLQPYRDAYADHITITFDRSVLEYYRPALELQGVDVRPSTIYAWSSSSNEFEYDVHTYVVYYQTQYGTTTEDSHKDDREIVQVYSDPQTREVREAVYSAGHWSAYRNTAPNTYVPDDGSGEHVTLEVDDSYHHHLGTDTIGSLGIDLEPLGTADKLFDEDTERTQYEKWLHNGLAGTLRPGAWVNGDIMRFREDYWAENRSTFRDRWGASVWRRLAGILPKFAVRDEFENTEYRN